MHSALAMAGVGVAAGLVVGIVGSPLVYAFWRARKTAMLSVTPTLGWSGTLLVSIVIVTAMAVIVAAAILSAGEMLDFLGSTLVACATAVCVWRGVIGLARAQESRH
jgi:hypothetical protein